MTKLQRQFLLDACEHARYPAEPLGDFSAWGMFGETTDAIVVDDAAGLLAAVADYMKTLPADELARAPDLSDLSDKPFGERVVLF